MLAYPTLSAALREQGAGKYLEGVHPDARRCGNETRGLLHIATRRALACVKEVDVMALICKLKLGKLDRADEENTALRLASYAP